MEKVTIPREVAEAIDEAKALGFSNEDIVFDLVVSACDIPGTMAMGEWLEHGGKFDVFLSALVIGYEAEMEPEEAIRAEYKRATSVWNKSTLVIEFENGVAYGIRSTLNRLGIKISGVNA